MTEANAEKGSAEGEPSDKATPNKTTASGSVTTDWRRIGWLVAATLILGAIIGVGAGLLTLLLYGVEHVMLGYIEGPSVPGPFAVPWVRRAMSVTAGLFIAAVIWYFLRTRTTKVPSVKKAVSGERMPWWQTIVHVVLQIFIVGSGASIGREVAPRELGAMLAQRFCDVFHLERADRRMIVAVAAGAGLGGVYDAPLAGMFFAAEILLASISTETIAFGLGMSAVAAYVASLIKGHHAFYDITAMQPGETPSLMLFALLCGAACGVAGALFRRGSSWAESHKPAGGRSLGLLWQMPLAGVLTGVVAIAVPQVMGNGRAAAQLGFSTFVGAAGVESSSGAVQSAASAAASPWTLLANGDDVVGGWLRGLGLGGASGSVGSGAARTVPSLDVRYLGLMLAILAVTFAAKAIVTLLTIRSGASGGVLQPGIALGATLGAMLGLVWTLAFPADSITACALIGAAALLSASQQAPLMAMCLVMELTEAPITFFVPVGMAVATSAFVSSWLLGRAARKPVAAVVSA
ncbi:chloride channel protein [Bifidobacterium sp. SMB2]|uniref:Chloride channel protein n=1 Tax=Bifidobacterium saimiriisciurei TaxID=2661627 RepID=A0ABX0CAS6_9BIFI|nr:MULTISPECIES: chloride channel protein [Bifidobacterium]NEG96210.1 chloride channel protein [Bifidobacterium sp. SMB2]NEH12223.1 chloride channel protein [Bifidobacterium saimiriisciurei]